MSVSNIHVLLFRIIKQTVPSEISEHGETLNFGDFEILINSATDNPRLQ